MILQPLEEGERAAAADPGAAEIGGAGLVGAVLLDAGEGEEAAHRRLLAGGDRRPCRPRRAPAAIAAAPSSSDRIMIPVACCTPSLHAEDVAAGDVAELVGDHALHLVGIVGRR